MAAEADPASDTATRDQLLDAIPALRAFALALTSDVDRVDDLIQDTLLRAWTHSDKFRRGTNQKAWLRTILRNSFYSQQRRRKREVEDPDESLAKSLFSLPEQEQNVDLHRIGQNLALLPANQREAFILVCAQGFSYAEAAKMCGAAEGTIKTRVRCARIRLMEGRRAAPYSGR